MSELVLGVIGFGSAIVLWLWMDYEGREKILGWWMRGCETARTEPVKQEVHPLVTRTRRSLKL